MYFIHAPLVLIIQGASASVKTYNSHSWLNAQQWNPGFMCGRRGGKNAVRGAPSPFFSGYLGSRNGVSASSYVFNEVEAPEWAAV